jgi:hypothetical protein
VSGKESVFWFAFGKGKGRVCQGIRDLGHGSIWRGGFFSVASDGHFAVG